MRTDPTLDRPAISAAGRYDALHADRISDVAFYAREAAAAGGAVLEVGCGTGRVSLAIAAAGVRITGLDRDPALLSAAAWKRAATEISPDDVGRGEGRRGRLTLVCADMRAYAFRRPFAAVVMPFRVFQSMLTVPDQLAALAAAHASLAPGGRLLLDLFDPRLDVLAEAAEGPAALAETGRYFRDARGRWRERVAARYDLESQIVDLTYVYERLADAGGVAERSFERLRVRYFTRWEFEHLLARAGYEVEALYGGWEGGPPTPEGEDMIWIATKRGVRRRTTRAHAGT
ncbi:MAG TPA: methyltransferase domain-containing protein [Gemmatimonadota bacterium]|nr:methyltransferase domain-containing protein [Gemmatimonadota bacterium]